MKDRMRNRYAALVFTIAVSLLGGCSGEIQSGSGRMKEPRETQSAELKTTEELTEEHMTAEAQTEAPKMAEIQTSGGRPAVSFADAGIEDGTYEFEGTLEGGSGRASFDGNLTLEVHSGKGMLTFTMSSEYYDYVKVGEKVYHPVNKSGNSSFKVPVDGVDYKFSFVGDTTAMSMPHEIDYSVQIDAEALKKVQ